MTVIRLKDVSAEVLLRDRLATARLMLTRYALHDEPIDPADIRAVGREIISAARDYEEAKR